MDIDIVVQNAFVNVKNNKERVSKIEQDLSTSIQDVEKAAKIILRHLYELNLIRVDTQRLEGQLYSDVDELSLAATIAMDSPTNKAVRLAMLIGEASNEELAQMKEYLTTEKRNDLKKLL